MGKFRFVSLLGVLLPSLLLGAATASAQDKEAFLSILGTRMDENIDKGYEADTGVSLGVGRIMSPRWNVEGVLQKFDPSGPAAQDQRSLGADLQRVFRRDRRFSPYLFMGVGVIDATLESGSPGTNNDTTPTYAAGFGFFAKIFGSSQVALRGEYRHREDHAFSSSGEDDFLSFGLHVPFGRSSAPPPVADSDGDGVPDGADRCPNTPMGRTVDAQGCEPAPPPVVDSDGDGVPDNLDRCPNTIAGARVDANGCELDSDGDGVVDRVDRCPNTVAGVAVDVYGCEIREEITLPGVNFETNSDRLLPSATNVLEGAVQTLRNNPTLVIEVQGHTDSDGTAGYNQVLSERRAIAVREFMLARGIEARRLTARGYGEADPLADNTSAAGKARNRRVVLRVLSR